MGLSSLLLLSAMVLTATAAGITEGQFNMALQANGYKVPPANVYQSFAQATQDFSDEEAAMFLAQLIHESGGFQFIEEIACKKSKCPGSYRDNVGLPGKYYYGRGYIQLTWASNYKAASQALGMGDKLLRNPDLVASDKYLPMAVSVWYWKANVRPKLSQNPNLFGITTKVINGMECVPGSHLAQKRYKYYLKVAQAFSLRNVAQEQGCYN